MWLTPSSAELRAVENLAVSVGQHPPDPGEGSGRDSNAELRQVSEEQLRVPELGLIRRPLQVQVDNPRLGPDRLADQRGLAALPWS